MYNVVAHWDWDGVVSALLLTKGKHKQFVIADYDELTEVNRKIKPPRLFTEVHRPDILMPGDILVDHHYPSIPEAREAGIQGLTGYVYMRLSSGYVLFWSRNTGRDYSNVRGIKSLRQSLAHIVPIIGNAMEPPDDIVRASDVIDNPNIAKGSEAAMVIGYQVLWDRYKLWKRLVKAKDFIHEARNLIKVFREAGAEIAAHIKLPSGSEPVLVVPRDRNHWYARAVMLWMQMVEEGKRPLYMFAKPANGAWKILLVSPRGNKALHIAKKLGGGGRPIPGGGSVAGATIQHLDELIKHTKPTIHEVTTPKQVLEIIDRYKYLDV